MSDELTDINISIVYTASQALDGGLTARVTVDASGTALFDIRDADGRLAPARLSRNDIDDVRQILYAAENAIGRAHRG